MSNNGLEESSEMRCSNRLHTGWSLPVVPGRFRSLLRNLSNVPSGQMLITFKMYTANPGQ